MSQVLQLALLGLGAAGIYVILAQGLIVIFRGSGILNLAHAGYATIGAYVFNGLHVTRAWSTAPAFIASVAIVAALGLATDQLIMRRLRGASALARVIATLGVLLILQALAMIIWGQNLIVVGPLLPQNPVSLLGTTVTSEQFWLLAIAVATTVILGFVWHRTRVGWVATAVAENQESAAAQAWPAWRGSWWRRSSSSACSASGRSSPIPWPPRCWAVFARSVSPSWVVWLWESRRPRSATTFT
jgi:branched-subunit amino acid ABC-type transport system permease component